MAAMTTNPHHPNGRRAVAAAAGFGMLFLAGALAVAPALAGCKSSNRLQEEGFGDHNPIGVPPEAKVVTHREAKDSGLLSPDSWFGADDLTFKPEHAGRAWVVDEQNARIVYQTRMRPGDELRLVPKDNAIQLNKAYVYTRPLPSEHGFVIYYAPNAETAVPTTAASTPGPR